MIDDENPIHSLSDLGEHVARNKDRASARRKISKEIPQPSHTFGVEPICRFVQYQQFRVAEQSGSETESLAHTKRISFHPALRRVLKLDQR